MNKAIFVNEDKQYIAHGEVFSIPLIGDELRLRYVDGGSSMEGDYIVTRVQQEINVSRFDDYDRGHMIWVYVQYSSLFNIRNCLNQGNQERK